MGDLKAASRSLSILATTCAQVLSTVGCTALLHWFRTRTVQMCQALSIMGLGFEREREGGGFKRDF